MNRLPAKTKGPIRVNASDHVIATVHAGREVSGVPPRVAQGLDRVFAGDRMVACVHANGTLGLCR